MSDLTSLLSSSNSDEEHALIAIHIAMQITLEFFHTNEWEHGRQDSVNPHKGVRDALGIWDL